MKRIEEEQRRRERLEEERRQREEEARKLALDEEKKKELEEVQRYIYSIVVCMRMLGGNFDSSCMVLRTLLLRQKFTKDDDYYRTVQILHILAWTGLGRDVYRNDGMLLMQLEKMIMECCMHVFYHLTMVGNFMWVLFSNASYLLKAY